MSIMDYTWNIETNIWEEFKKDYVEVFSSTELPLCKIRKALKFFAEEFEIANNHPVVIDKLLGFLLYWKENTKRLQDLQDCYNKLTTRLHPYSSASASSRTQKRKELSK